jgi:diadenosine tetraphosphate (Ap4A) HIT family hydrolase
MTNKDQLSWEEFYKQCNGRSSLPVKVEEFNRLVAHTKNFFVISGYGAFTPGYLLIISKDFIPSYGLVEKSQLDELNFLIRIIKQTISNELERQSVVFEHGMCACIGGLDRAHIHIMSIPKNTKQKNLIDSIESVLYNRKAGIEYIEYNNYKLQNIHDINHIYEDIISKKNHNEEFKIVGKLFEIKDIQNLSVINWPLITFDHINKGGHYVYFKSDFDESSFLTTNNFETQFGREVVFQNELILNNDFKKIVKNLEENNKNLNVWRWQHHVFESEILKSMKIAKVGLNKLKNANLKEFKEYCLEII